MIISCPSCSARFKVDANAIGQDGRMVKCSQCGHTWQARAEDDEAGAAPAESAPAPSPPPKPAAEPAPEPAAADEEPPPPPPPPAPQAAADDIEVVSNTALEAAVAGQVGSAADADAPAPEPAAEADEAVEEEPIPEPPAQNGAAPPPPEPPPLPTQRELAGGRKNRAGRAAVWAFVILVVLVAGAGTGVYVARERLVSLFPPLNLVLNAVGLGVPHLGDGLDLPTPSAALDEQGLRISGYVVNKRGEILEIPLLRGALCDANSEEIYVWTFRAEDSRVLPGERIGYETVIQDAPAAAKDIRIAFTTEAEAAAESVANGKPRTCR